MAAPVNDSHIRPGGRGLLRGEWVEDLLLHLPALHERGVDDGRRKPRPWIW
jgi:hypothetical protein